MFSSVYKYLYISMILYILIVFCFETYFFYIIITFSYRKIKEYVPKPKVKFKQWKKPNYGINESWASKDESLINDKESSPSRSIVIEDLEVVPEVTEDEASAALLTPSNIDVQ